LLSIFVAAVFYMTLIFHLTNLYGTQHHGVERFLLLEGGVFTQVFWIGQIGIGTLAPLALFWLPGINKSRGSILLGSLMVVIGGLSQIFVIIIGAQAYPLTLFPGKTVSSSFFDGAINTYSPSLPEWVLGISGFGIALLATLIAIRVLPFLPQRLADAQTES
jgi:molybdopterin-containing oxidoreductase family membrane subunit